MPKTFEFCPLYSGGSLHLANHDIPVIIDLDSWQKDPAGTEYPALVQHCPAIEVGKIVPEIGKNEDGTPNITARGTYNNNLQSVFLQNLIQTGRKFESSIRTVDPLPTDYQYIPKGEKITVNKREFLGPCKVLRNWKFQEGSFVFEGADAYNKVVAAGRDVSFLNFIEKGKTMSEELRAYIISLGYTEPEELTPEQFAVAERAFKALNQTAAEEAKKQENEPCKAESETGNEGDSEKEESTEGEKEDAPENETEKEPEADKDKEKGQVAAAATFKKRSNPARSLSRGDVGSGQRRPGRNEIIEAALLMNSGMNPDKVAASAGKDVVHEATGAKWRNISLGQMLLMAIEERTGKRFYGGCSQCTNEIFQMLQDDSRKSAVMASGGAGFSTIGALAILNNVLNKTFKESWENFNSVVDKIAMTNVNRDLRTGYFVDYSIVGNLQEVAQDGEIKTVTLTSPEVKTKVKTYACNLTLTEEMLINDDLGAFARIPKKLARKIRVLREKMAFKVLEDNLATFCTTAKGNKLSSNNALNIAGYNAAAAALKTLETDGSTPDSPEFTDAEGKFVLVPPTLLPTAETLYRDTKCDLVGLGSNPMTNPHVGRYSPLSSAYWSSSFNSQTNTQWAMFTDPEEAAALIISHLQGQETPRIEQHPTQPNTMGFTWRAIHREGYDMGDWRAMVYSTGTGT